jgi:hypothetical protein
MLFFSESLTQQGLNIKNVIKKIAWYFTHVQCDKILGQALYFLYNNESLNYNLQVVSKVLP